MENAWAFGAIHNGLVRELFPHGILASILDWREQYTEQEFLYLNSVYDLFVTVPPVAILLHNHYKIPLEKIIMVAHGELDILKAHPTGKNDALFDQVRGYGVISQSLRYKSIEFGIRRDPTVVRTAVPFDLFYSPPANRLNHIGYGGVKEAFDFFGNEIKRGRLVENVVNGIDGVRLKVPDMINHNCMPGYYQTIDALVISSTQEAGGLPAMEAAAAGRLVMGTPVGFLGEDGEKGAGILLPMDADPFQEKLKETIELYRDDAELYRAKCEEIQTYARENYDWKHVIHQWVDLFTAK